MTSTKQSPHVLIVGAGLAGMTLAQALRKKGITFEIFERDEGVHSRFQGWAIALHKILPDLESSLPEDIGDIHSTNHLLPLDLKAEFKIYVGNELIGTGNDAPDHPLVRANRNKLRDFLSQKLDVQWGKCWTRIDESSDGVTLHFDDGTSAHGDLLVGADGTRSKVRHHIFSGNDTLYTLPLGIINGEAKIPREEYTQIMTHGRSAYINVSQNGTQRIMTAVNSIDPSGDFANYYWAASWVEHDLDEHDLPDTHRMSQEALLESAKQHVTDIDPKFLQVLQHTTSEGIMSPPIVIRDIVLDSIPASRVTLVGDSAHAMSMFRGEGGNLALQDSLDLARVIEQIKIRNSTREQMFELLAEYQAQMLRRSKPIVLASRAAALGETYRTNNFSGWADKAYESNADKSAKVEPAIPASAGATGGHQQAQTVSARG